MKAGKGISPIKEMVQHGITVGLGTDGPSSGNTLDFIYSNENNSLCSKNTL